MISIGCALQSLVLFDIITSNARQTVGRPNVPSKFTLSNHMTKDTYFQVAWRSIDKE